MREPTDALVEYERGQAWPAVRIEPVALRLFLDAIEANRAWRLEAADSLYVAADRSMDGRAPVFSGGLAMCRARIAWNQRAFAEAESLNQAGFELRGETAPYCTLTARIAAVRGDREGAREAVRHCLALDPGDPDGLEFARLLGVGRQPPP